MVAVKPSKPTASLNRTVSLVDLPCDGPITVIDALLAVDKNGFNPNRFSTDTSVLLSGLGSNKAVGSGPG